MAETIQKNVKDAQLKRLLAGVIANLGLQTDEKIKDATPGVATAAKPGLVKGGGTGISIAADGTISATGTAAVDPSALPLASPTQKGAVIIGDGIDMTDGKISVSGDYAKKADASTIAQQKVDALKFKTINGESLKGEGNIVIDLSLYKLVQSLPATGIDENKIYLVANTETVPEGELNTYVEYIHVDGKWEKVGEYRSAVDLTPYAKKTDLDNYYAKGDESVREIYDSLTSILSTRDLDFQAFNDAIVSWMNDNAGSTFVDEANSNENSYANQTFAKIADFTFMTDEDVDTMLSELFPATA